MKSVINIICLLFTINFFSQELLLHYSFDNDLNDISGNNYHGSPFGNLVYAEDRFGNSNSAVYFDGVNDYIELPNISYLKPNLPLSISFWIKYEGTSYQDRAVFNTSFEEDVNSGVFFTSQSTTGKYALGYGDGTFNYSASSRRSYVSNSQIDTGVWHHILIVVVSSDNMKVYVDCIENGGVYSGSGGSIQYSNFSGTIGKHDQNNGIPAFYFKGIIDDFKYWSGEIIPVHISPIFTSIPTSICENETYILPSISDNGITGSWTPIFDNTILGTTEYTFFPDVNQCALSITSSINVVEETFPIFTSIPTSICENETYILPPISDNGITGSWTPIFDNTVLGATEYTFFPDVNKCVILNTIQIIVNNTSGTSCTNIYEFEAPNFFTPNNDGYNDYWNIKGLNEDKYRVMYIQVYNRFGKKLANVAPYGKGWDGNYNGKPLPSSDYWYAVTILNEDGTETLKRGNFSLIRR